MNQIKWTNQRVRQTFIDYFRERDHMFIPSSSVIPHHDPTLHFTNAGMNQFKNIFLGLTKETDEEHQWKSAVNSQKCIRAGGKHNDLDDVGNDTYHHTFFEMLGNWSFSGTYFKEEAIEYAWKLLTEVYKLPKDQIYVSYFGGNDAVGADTESRDIWKKYVDESRILPFDEKDNFWEMDATGPCGPCSEIHFDRIGGRDASALVNADDPDVIEIWNLVFIQFNRESDGNLKLLPKQHVDTGLGFERICSILQNVRSNYDTDVFIPIFEEIRKITNARKYTGKLGEEDVDGIDTAYRVLADHIRTVTIALADGGLPSSKDRGYVLRRIIRRAIRFGRQYFNTKPGFFSELVDVVVLQLSDAFDISDPQKIKNTILDEEMLFEISLNKGIKRFQKMIRKAKKKGVTVISGEDAHILSRSFGFPYDLIEIMASEEKFTIDKGDYDTLVEEYKQISRDARKGSDKILKLDVEDIQLLQDEGVPMTETNPVYSWKDVEAKVLRIFTKEDMFIDSTKKTKAEDIGLILESTAFYAEAGGQVSDTGILRIGNAKFHVFHVKDFAGYRLHIGEIRSGEIQVGQVVSTQVDFERRAPIAANHTSTHMLNHCLRKVLNYDTKQRGSLVDEDHLRFQFEFHEPLTEEQLEQVQKLMQEMIQSNLPVYARVQPYEKAKLINGLRYEFAKYPKDVRVISIAKDNDVMIDQPEKEEWMDYSVEFCGGTHLSNTNEAEHFAIMQHTSAGSGVRTIVAVTKDSAVAAFTKAEAFKKRIEKLKSLSLAELTKQHKVLLNEFEEYKKDSIFPILDRFFMEKEFLDLTKKMQNAAKKEEKDSLALAKKELIPELVKEHANSSFVVLVLDIEKYPAAHELIFNLLKKKFAKKNLPFVMLYDGKFRANVPKKNPTKIQQKEWMKICAQGKKNNEDPQSIKEKLVAYANDHSGESQGQTTNGQTKGQTNNGQNDESSHLKQRNEKLKQFVKDVDGLPK